MLVILYLLHMHERYIPKPEDQKTPEEEKLAERLAEERAEDALEQQRLYVRDASLFSTKKSRPSKRIYP